MRHTKRNVAFMDELGNYFLRAKVEKEVIRTGEPDDFVDEYEGDILCWQGET